MSFARLIAGFGSALAVLEEAVHPGARPLMVAATVGLDGGSATLSPQAAEALCAAAAAPERYLDPVRRSGVTVLTLADEAYPSRLRSIDLPPPVLYLHGDPAALDRPRSVAIVGTRRPTEAGRSTAGHIADGVAALGATVVSGLALGIDGAAHAAAVRAGAPTVAVIGGGHERLYPSAHRALARSIATGGGTVLSEFPPDTQPSRGTFPRRNRIISGLADATVVVEAGLRSGALTTAAWALEQGRTLYLVPGRPGDPSVAGCLAFLREAGPEARIVAGVPRAARGPGPPRARAAAGRLPVTRRSACCPVSRRRWLSLSPRAWRRSTSSSVPPVPRARPCSGALTSLEIRGLVVEAFGRYRAAGPLAARGPIERPAITAISARHRGRAA